MPDSLLPYGPPIKYVTPKEVKNTNLKYPNKKSPGFDLITAEVTKCLPTNAIVLLTYTIKTQYYVYHISLPYGIFLKL